MDSRWTTDGEFRGFEEREKNRAFVRDLVDGYSHEFKDTHPEGVPFRLIDKSDERHDAGFRAFTGEAARLDGAEPRESEARGAAPARLKPTAAGAVIKPKPKTKAFLDKLPGRSFERARWSRFARASRRCFEATIVVVTLDERYSRRR